MNTHVVLVEQGRTRCALSSAAALTGGCRSAVVTCGRATARRPAMRGGPCAASNRAQSPLAAPARSSGKQQALYFLPLPHGQRSLRARSAGPAVSPGRRARSLGPAAPAARIRSPSNARRAPESCARASRTGAPLRCTTRCGVTSRGRPSSASLSQRSRFSAMASDAASCHASESTGAVPRAGDDEGAARAAEPRRRSPGAPP